jgi:SAM-dependent methyltransferase
VPEQPVVDVEAVRDAIRDRYRAVAENPAGSYHCHTGRRLATLLGYRDTVVDVLPDRAVESFSGVANPFALRRIREGERVVDVGSGAGFDSFLAVQLVGPSGRVIGVEMTSAMIDKARETARVLGLDGRVEFREGLAERLPVEDGWADVVIANGVFNLCPDKRAVFAEVRRVLRTGGVVQFAEIANSRPFPVESVCHVDPGTGWGCISAGLSRTGWLDALDEFGFVNAAVGPAVDTFAGAAGEPTARRYEVYGYSFIGYKP